MNKSMMVLLFFITLSCVVWIANYTFSKVVSEYEEGTQQHDILNWKESVYYTYYQNSPTAQVVFEQARTQGLWYVSRASGLLAGFLLMLLMLSGTGFITGSTFRFLEPISAWATHKALGIALAVAVFVHIGVLYFETFVSFDITSLLVPFASDYKPIELFGVYVGSLYVALGILALYIFLAVILTSLYWIEKKPHTWKAIHTLSYIGMVFVFVHALFLGTDLAQGALRYVWIGGGVLVVLGALQRFWRIKTV